MNAYAEMAMVAQVAFCLWIGLVACVAGGESGANADRPANDSGTCVVSSPFLVKLEEGGTLGGRSGFDLRIDEKAQLSYVLKGEKDVKGTVALPEKAILQIRSAAATFVKKPAPFLTVHKRLSGGGTCSVEVWVGGETRGSIIFAWSNPEEVRTLVGQVSLALQDVHMEEALRERLVKALNEFQTVDPASNDNANLLSFPNGSPEELVDKVAALGKTVGKEKFPESPEADWMSNGLAFLAGLEHVRLGDRLFAAYRRYPEYPNDIRLAMLQISVMAGCLDGLNDVLPLARKVADTPGEEYHTLKLFVEEMLEGEALKSVLSEVRERKLSGSNSDKVCRWLLAHRDQLEFRPEIHKFTMKVKPEKGERNLKPQTP